MAEVEAAAHDSRTKVAARAIAEGKRPVEIRSRFDSPARDPISEESDEEPPGFHRRSGLREPAPPLNLNPHEFDPPDLIEAARFMLDDDEDDPPPNIPPPTAAVGGSLLASVLYQRRVRLSFLNKRLWLPGLLSYRSRLGALIGMRRR